MTKPDITLEPSKAVVSNMAAQIYAAYITRGAVKDGEEASWMQRSIREAVRIAKTVDASVESDDEPDTHQVSTVDESQTPAPGTTASSTPDAPASPAAEGAAYALEDPAFNEAVGDALRKKPE